MRINNLPGSSGVYILKDIKNKPIYVGKAGNIKNRVRTHLVEQKESAPKSKIIQQKTTSVEAIQVDSEIEALILEASLIKKFKPPLNSQLKDDKDYLYIKVTKELFPRVLTARKRNLKGAETYFGPFPSARNVRTTLKTLRRIFPFSSCSPNKRKPCLHYHLGLCPGVCAGLITEEEYGKNVKDLNLFLQGKKTKLFDMLERELSRMMRNLEFEQAAQLKEKIEALKYVTKPVRGIEYLDGDMEEIRDKELSDLAHLIGLGKKPKRIECYDISNMLGKEATGSMVVFNRGLADRSEYRRFKIKTVRGISDTAMIAEVLQRRFRNKWQKPDLIVIDGGRGQLNAAKNAVKKLGLGIPVVSLAKRLEEIYLKNRKKPIRLPRYRDALKLTQRMRDEAHRFALAYHRKLRSKKFLPAR
ncbi:MAG TPA: excinuclease ABC subunit UvrC [Candidatus Nanoarchaeia archaeon]